jgi:hypothetical protein
MKKEHTRELNEYDKGMILALCLGDGCLRKPHPQTHTVQLEIGHSIKQMEYCKYKRDLLVKILGTSFIPKISLKRVVFLGKEYESCRFVKVHDYFTYLRKKLYINNRKTITRELLDMLPLEGIAIWYMDDGSCYFKESPKDGHSICIDLRISTDCFTYEEHLIMIQYFQEKWGVKFYPFYSKRRNCFILRANKTNAIKFINLIKPYVIDSMKYKCNIKLQECETSVQTDEDIV